MVQAKCTILENKTVHLPWTRLYSNKVVREPILLNMTVHSRGLAGINHPKYQMDIFIIEPFLRHSHLYIAGATKGVIEKQGGLVGCRTGRNRIRWMAIATFSEVYAFVFMPNVGFTTGKETGKEGWQRRTMQEISALYEIYIFHVIPSQTCICVKKVK